MDFKPSDYVLQASKDLKLLAKSKKHFSIIFIPSIVAIIFLIIIWFIAPLGSYWPLDTMALLIPITFFSTILTITTIAKQFQLETQIEQTNSR